MKCSICGKEIDANFVEEVSKVMVENKWCYECFFWNSQLEADKHRKFAVIDGGHYVIAEDAPKGFRGFGGAEFKIRFFNGEQITTHNLWFQGEIPEEFKDKMPDNAEFVE